MAKHSKVLKSHPPEWQRQYQRYCAVYRSSKATELSTELQHVQAAIDLQKARMAEAASASLPLRLSNCQLTPADLELFASTWAAKYGPSMPHDVGDLEVLAPPPSSDELVKLAEHAVWEPSQPAPQPWMGQVAARR
eukprot:1805839-Alexandrium_andersonii.AAC.1